MASCGSVYTAPSFFLSFFGHLLFLLILNTEENIKDVEFESNTTVISFITFDLSYVVCVDKAIDSHWIRFQTLLSAILLLYTEF